MTCLNLPGLSPLCLTDVGFRFGGFGVDLTQPGYIVGMILALTFGIFLFRHPA